MQLLGVHVPAPEHVSPALQVFCAVHAQFASPAGHVSHTAAVHRNPALHVEFDRHAHASAPR
jgi:hypothetical protein